MFEILRQFIDLRQRTLVLADQVATNKPIVDRLLKVQQELYDLSVMYEKDMKKL